MSATKVIRSAEKLIREATPQDAMCFDSQRGLHQCRLSLPASCGIPSPCGLPCELFIGPERHAVVELGNMARLAVMIEPGLRGSFRRQAEELIAQLMCIVRLHRMTLTATTMMVFLRDGADEAECRNVLGAWFGDAMPVTTFVVQPPCGGGALAIELWALSGPGVKVERLGPELIAVESDGIRWIYCGGIRGEASASDPYSESATAFQRMQHQLATAGICFDQVVRTWIYVNQITTGENGRQRYQEMNRARTDFFREIPFGRRNRAMPAGANLPLSSTGRGIEGEGWSGQKTLQELSGSSFPPLTPALSPLRGEGDDARTLASNPIYPASTGIGTSGANIAMACMALNSKRPDVFILPLENPQQTPACAYQATYSPQSPKFSRAMAVVQGHFITTLVSGTASIVDAKTVHIGDIARQTEQTIDNIEKLIAPENFARHGLSGGGATLRDIAKLRVYVKRQNDYEICREVVERRLPRVPAIYLHADVCRPDLLVEIEAVAFSPFGGLARNGHVNGMERKEDA